MRLLSLVGFFCLACCSTQLLALAFKQQPVALFYAPNSLIGQISPDFMQYVGHRARLSTCTGVAWLLAGQGYTIVSANLLEGSLLLCYFDPRQNRCTLLAKYDKTVTQLNWPENLSISPDGQLLAISDSYCGTIAFYQRCPDGLIIPHPIALLHPGMGDIGLHGIRFSPDGHYLGYVTYDGLGKVRLFRIEKNEQSIALQAVCSIENSFVGLAPKGLDFSQDGRYVAITYSAKAAGGCVETSGKVAIFAFDACHGFITSEPISQIGIECGLNIPEDVLFCSEDRFVLVSNQGGDTISLHGFDPQSGRLSPQATMALDAASGLNFPHGFAISPDGKFLAVSNYGDDKIAIYAFE